MDKTPTGRNFFKSVRAANCPPLDFSLDPKFVNFYPSNFMRSVVLQEFDEVFHQIFSENTPLKVAIIGGTRLDPEIRWLQSLGYNLEVDIYGIENYDFFMDLNTQGPHDSKVKYNLVLCSQVWEHIWRHEVAFENLVSFLGSDTFLWLAAPALNRAHGSPDYFSAGFSENYFQKNLELRGCEIIFSKTLGSRRYFQSLTLLPKWLSVQSHKYPVIFPSQYNGLLAKLFVLIRYFPTLIYLSLISPKILSDQRFGCETIVLAKKKN